MKYFKTLLKKEIAGKNAQEILEYTIYKCFNTLYESSIYKDGLLYVNLSSVKLDADDIFLICWLTFNQEFYNKHCLSSDSTKPVVKIENEMVRVYKPFNKNIFALIRNKSSEHTILQTIETDWFINSGITSPDALYRLLHVKII